MSEITIGLDAVTKLDSCLGIIAKYVGRLKADPDRAATDLAEALDEIENSCRALGQAITKYLSLGFKPNALSEQPELLLALGGGSLLVSVKKGLGSCHKIANIYCQTLDRWFERVFKNDTASYQELGSVFRELSGGDGTMFDMMAIAAERVQQLANEALDLLSLGKNEEAQRHVLGSRSELNPLLMKINKLLARLFDLRADFVEISGT